ncbi:ADP-ribose pyrophosphatase, mitochondrial-like [Dendronephthya gigantea]|uniref:ADP-ribose pyrophosphatase, mitochondrial-like n=1 Tax=Dendronephthya gigantea TaxID=151771 RepID=UPI00106C1278|nr:ADP-ribose pyrophosphatase, mitochondrial-like [Dendronephthya gigantea]
MIISVPNIVQLARAHRGCTIIPVALFTFNFHYVVVTNRRRMHTKARGPNYPGTSLVKKCQVGDEFVKWSVAYNDYKPVEYTSDTVLSKPLWADPDISQCKPEPAFQYNSRDDHYNVDRTSFTGKYQVIDDRPRNPMGRTGMTGRGLLGRWGPNHAADPLVTRWKINGKGQRVQENGKPILEFVAIKRKDNEQWAIPGGMVDPGDTVSATLKKEFGEEALNSLELSEKEQEKLHSMLTKLFQKGQTIWSGYVDDPRNTDNSWMETVAVNYHDELGEVFRKFQLQAGDDAGDVRWLEVRGDIELYASHKDILERTARFHFAFW